MARVRARGVAGFTLMELLIVVIIVGILATLALPQFPRAMERARQAEARAILGQIYQGERLYYAERNIYVGATPGANPLAAALPDNTSTENYFAYAASAPTSASFIGTATRKKTGGKTPPWPTAYTITVNQAGDFTVSAF